MITHLVLNSFTHDSRVLRAATAVTDSTFTSEVYALHDQGTQQREVSRGVTIHRIPLTSRSLPRFFGFQLIKYGEWLLRCVFRCRDSKLIHAHDLATLPAACLCGLFNSNCKIIYDAHEFEAGRLGRRGIKKWLATKLEKMLLPKVHGMITVNQQILELYQQNGPLPSTRVIHNLAEQQVLPKNRQIRQKLGIAETTHLYLYQGNLSRGRGITLLLKLFQSSGLPDNSCLLLLGAGELEEEIQQTAQNSQNIFYHPMVSQGELPQWTQMADTGFCLIEDCCQSYRYCLPNKIFEYLQAGLPIITSPLPVLSKFVGSQGIGVVSRKMTIESIQKSMIELQNIPQSPLKNRIKKTATNWCWDKEKAILLDFYEHILKK